MWFPIKTDVFSEQQSMDLLREQFPETITDIYFPIGRRVYKTEGGGRESRFTPILQGIFFIRVVSEKRLLRILSQHGYFMYKGVYYEPGSTERVERTFFAKAHILCSNSKSSNIKDIVCNARIPDEDMERFIYFNDTMAEGIEGLSIVDKRYSDLVKVNDTIRILSGPMAGWVGVVKQIKHKGKKDRHLLVRFGNNSCLSISNIRQFDMQIEREAPSDAVEAWRAIDQMIGYLQAKEPEKNACQTLRKLFADYQKKLTISRSCHSSDIAYSKKTADRNNAHQQAVLDNIDESMQSNFRILAKFFHSDKSTLEQGLQELIPDAVLRPFLTPTPGATIPDDQSYTIFRHNGITEFILRCNLREFFRDKEYEADKYAPVFDEDYEYYAHFALLKTKQGMVKVICSWGGFYDYYASQNKVDRNKFLADLEAKKYHRLLHLLTQSQYTFEQVSDIGGFSIDTDIPYTADTEELGRRANEYFTLHSSLFTPLTAAAVEVWQGARLLVWRKLLQRYVLLHRVPVVDKPYVITPDTTLEQAFAKTDDQPNIATISTALAEMKETIETHIEKDEIAYAVFRLLSTSLVFSSHYAEDELYNKVSDTFDPDTILTELFNLIVEKIPKPHKPTHGKPHTPSSTPTLLSHLHKGMTELQSQDSWIYFKFPSFLKQIRTIL